MVLGNQNGAGSFPGVDFEVILQGVDAGVSIANADPVSRALIVGLTFGLQLGAEKTVKNWPLRAAFERE